MVLRTTYKMQPPLSVRLKPGHPLADKLIADWLLREGSGVKAFDASGRHHTGTLTGGATWTMGKFGRAVDLDGTDGHIEVADHSDFTPALAPFSISALVYMRDASDFMIARKGEAPLSLEWYFVTSRFSKFYFTLMDSGQGCYIGRYYNTALTTLQNTWLHVVATYNGGTSSSGIKLYLNARRIDDTDNESLPFVTVGNFSESVMLGRSGTNYSDGLIDSVTIWRRVLTLSDVQLLHYHLFRRFEQRSMLRSAAAGAA